MLILLICFPHWTAAQVRVTKQAGVKSSLSLQGLAATDAAAGTCMQTLKRDLERSGWFRLTGDGAALNLTGRIETRGKQLRAECWLMRPGERRPLLSQRFNGAAERPQALAHEIADAIVEAATGRPGIAASRIAMIGTASGHKEIYLGAAFGGPPAQLTRDRDVNLAPAWSPDGTRLFYTSYVNRFPDVFVVDLPTGKRKVVASYPGMNTGAAVSPDGRQLALILSKDGNPELYVQELAGGRLTRLTRSPRAAEASPCWSPDGRRICYVSDHSGAPQLYLISRTGGRPQRLRVRGSENVAPDWGANNRIAYSSRIAGTYQIFTVDPDGRQAEQVSSGYADYEDPSWAPDGRHIACSRTEQHRSAIYILDTMGDPPIAYHSMRGDWFSPAWSP